VEVKSASTSGPTPARSKRSSATTFCSSSASMLALKAPAFSGCCPGCRNTSERATDVLAGTR